MSDEEIQPHIPMPVGQLSDFQRQAINYMIARENVLITAHTGSGKTLPAQFACSYFNRVIYTGPIKALLNQKYRDFCAIYGADAVGIITGDIRRNPDARIIITTLECYRNEVMNAKLLQTGQDLPYEQKFNVSNIDCVIFDEVHWIRDPDRGQSWQEAIMLTPPTTVVLMLSATMSNPTEFANWTASIYGKPTHLLSTDRRIVPLEFHMYDLEQNNIGPIRTPSQCMYAMMKKHHSLNDMITRISALIRRNNLSPALIVSFSRRQCEELARMGSTQFLKQPEVVEVRRIWDQYMWKYESVYGTTQQFRSLQNLLLRGIAYHHAGMIPVLKEMVEILMERRYIHLLFSTETFAVGINMPIRTVVMTSLEKPTGRDGERRVLRPDEFIQIAGRAGRRGIDTVGTVILLPNDNSSIDIGSLIQGQPCEIPKKFKWSMSTMMQLIVQHGPESNDLEQFYSKSYAYIGDTAQLDAVRQELAQLEPPAEPSQRIRQLEARMELYDLLDRGDQKRLILEINRDRESHTWFSPANKSARARYAHLTKILDNANHMKDQLVEGAVAMELLTPEHQPTELGILVSMIHDSNEILLAKLIQSIDWQNVTVPQFGAILASLSDETYATDYPCVCGQMHDLFRQMDRIVNQYEELIRTRPIFASYKWELTVHFMNPVYDWLSGNSFRELIEKYDGLYEGTFIRYAMRMRQLFDTVYQAARFIRNDHLATLAQEAQRLMIRDEVRMDSLYIV